MISVIYELADDLPAGEVLDIVEDRGRLVFRVASWLTLEEAMPVLCTGASGVLAGGHWFQEWKGDIIAANPADAVRHLPLQGAAQYDAVETDEA
ncbi:hypothetical protein ACWEPB_02460 [Kitasatospora cineracea]